MTVIENDSPKEFFEGPFEVSDLIPFTFPYTDRTDVKVKIGDEAATYGVEYEISAESPSSILVKVNIDSGVQVTVYRETPIDQQSSYPQNSKFRSEQVESDFDKVCMIQQEQKEMLARCLRVPVENIVAFDGELPSPQEGKILVWSDEGKIVNSPSTITEIEDSVDTAVSNAATALSSASEAVLTAESAEQKATTALSQSTTALNNSTAAVTSADSAVSTANSASAAAASAVEAATYASNKVDDFGEDIETVLEAAEQIEELEEAIDEALEAAGTAEEAAATATEAAEEAVQALSTKQDVLVSGTNIKTVNSTSLLGSGNIDVGTVTSVNNVQPVDGDVTIAIPDISNLADKDLSNLSSTGQGILDNKLNRQQVTNCIIESPQRVKYTLANGVLTILAGSIIVVPYGTTDLSSTINVGDTFIHSNLKVYDTYWDSTNSKFYVWTELQADVVRAASTSNAGIVRALALYFDSSTIGVTAYGNAESGSSDSSASNTSLFYNTSSNLVKRKDSGTMLAYTCSFPIVKVASNTTYMVAEVRQVFNGFGYIGSVVWADKGIKGLIPNGRNADGSLNNIEYTTENITVINTNPLSDRTHVLVMRELQPNIVIHGSNVFSYDPEQNYNFYYPDGIRTIYEGLIAGIMTFKSGKITGFTNNALNINSMCDGGWVDSNLTIASSVNAPSSGTPLEYDLSNYLPIDGNNYEVILTGAVTTGTTSGNTVSLRVYSNILNNYKTITTAQTRSSSSVSGGGTLTLPVGLDKKIYVSSYSGNTGTFSLFARGYRRLGTNA